MKQIKSKLSTIVLGLVIGVLIISVFFISFMIQGDTDSSPAAPKTTKAAAITYSKILAINKPQPTEMPTILPTTIISPTVVVVPSEDPTPTEIILAYNNISPTEKVVKTSSTVAPTKTAILPESGYIQNSVFIFLAASLVIFFSFLF